MKAIEIVKPVQKEIVVDGITFFLNEDENYIAIDFNGDAYAYRSMPNYMRGVGIWSPFYHEVARYIGSVVFEFGDSFDKVYEA